MGSGRNWAQNFEQVLTGPKFVPPKAYPTTPSPRKLLEFIVLCFLLFCYCVIAVVVTCCSLKRESGQSQCLLFYSCPALPCPTNLSERTIFACFGLLGWLTDWIFYNFT